MREHRSDSGVLANSATPLSNPPAVQSLRARLAAYALHAQRDARETTVKARAAFNARFERQVDPNDVLSLEERRQRAIQARAAYFARLSLAGVKARRRKTQGGGSA